MTPYQVTLATYVHGGTRGPAGWGAVVRREDRVAHYRGHACNATKQEVEDGARALLISSLSGRMHFFTKLDGPLSESSRADVLDAEKLARSAAVVLDVLMEVVK